MLAALKLSSVINRSGTTFGGVLVPRLAPLALALLLQSATSLNAQDSGALPSVPTPADVKPGSINCEECPYPHPSKYLDIQVYTQDARIAYMDVPAEGAANGHTVLLLHGNNFGGFYFTSVIDALRKAGFRVVVPDQIGYGRSSKPVVPYNAAPRSSRDDAAAARCIPAGRRDPDEVTAVEDDWVEVQNCNWLHEASVVISVLEADV